MKEASSMATQLLWGHWPPRELPVIQEMEGLPPVRPPSYSVVDQCPNQDPSFGGEGSSHAASPPPPGSPVPEGASGCPQAPYDIFFQFFKCYTLSFLVI